MGSYRTGHPAGFGLSAYEFCQQCLDYESTLPISAELRKGPLAKFLHVSMITLNKWLPAWGLGFPPWPRDFLDLQGRAVLVCICDAKPPFRVHWMSPNCELLLGHPQDYYVGQGTWRLRGTECAFDRTHTPLHEARLAATDAPNVPQHVPSTTLAVAGQRELPVSWTITYGQHQTSGGYSQPPIVIGTYCISMTQLGEAHPEAVHLQEPLAMNAELAVGAEQDLFNVQPFLISPGPPFLTTTNGLLTTTNQQALLAFKGMT